jgi:ferredoxin-NADP reductase
MRLTLVEKKPEAGDAISFRFSPDVPISWQAGQYLHYVLPHTDPDDRGVERWFTIASAPHEGHIQVTTRMSEPHSTFKGALNALPIGGTIEADGPEGDFIADDPSSELILIAGGIGVTPYRAMLLDLDHKGVSINAHLLWANRTNDFPFREELEALQARHQNFRIRYVVNPERIDEAFIRANVLDLQKPIFYTSGPEPMVLALIEVLRSMGVPDAHNRKDDFPGYDWP